MEHKWTVTSNTTEVLTIIPGKGPGFNVMVSVPHTSIVYPFVRFSSYDDRTGGTRLTFNHPMRTMLRLFNLDEDAPIKADGELSVLMMNQVVLKIHLCKGDKVEDANGVVLVCIG